MDEAAGDHQEVACTRLNGLPTTLTELDRHGTRDHVDDRVVAAVMVQPLTRPGSVVVSPAHKPGFANA